MAELLTPRSDNNLIAWWWSLDRVVLACILILAMFGIVMVGTASPSVAVRIGLDGYHFLYRHIMLLLPALVLLIGMSWLDLRTVWRFASIMFGAAALGVVMTLIGGMAIKGATRWIHIMGFSLQPSEFLKPAFIILSAWFLGKQKTDTDFPGVIIALGLYALTVGLLILQPDFGMTFLVSVVFAAQIFLAGCPLRYIIILGLIGIAGIGLAYISLDHVQSRIDRFLMPQSGDSYQVDRSMEAFMNGGLIGTGPGQGVVKLQIPDVHSDFIFSAIGEEWGFLFTALLVGLFAFLFYRLLRRISRSDSIFVMLAGSGLVIMLVIQCIVHMGSALRLLPAKGMTLPLISYGGSSLMAVGISFGLILALTRGITDGKASGGWRHLRKKDF